MPGFQGLKKHEYKYIPVLWIPGIFLSLCCEFKYVASLNPPYPAYPDNFLKKKYPAYLACFSLSLINIVA